MAIAASKEKQMAKIEKKTATTSEDQQFSKTEVINIAAAAALLPCVRRSLGRSDLRIAQSGA
jgi:hypothetical protein